MAREPRPFSCTKCVEHTLVDVDVERLCSHRRGFLGRRVDGQCHGSSHWCK